MDFIYECSDCGKTYDGSEIRYRCTCSDTSHTDIPAGFQRGNLIVRYEPESLRHLRSKSHLSPSDLTPYPGSEELRRRYPAGDTPLIRDTNLAKRYGLPGLAFKDDSKNPSGSFKDRASFMIALQAQHHGIDTVVLASTGNAGSAMACAGAACGLKVILFVPESAPMNKLMQSVLYGATVIPIQGTYDDAFALSIAYSQEFGGINRNTAYNPMTIEGKKSVSLELYHQFANRPPDIIYIPVGDGVILSGVHKGFQDLLEAGAIDSMPRLVCVQSAGSAAISNAIISGIAKPIDSASTLADSISVSSPACGYLAMRAVLETDGWATIVSDEEILFAQKELAKDAGMFVEPAAAAAWAGLRADIASGRVTKDHPGILDPVVLLTGIGFKDMDVFKGSVHIPRSVPAQLDAVITELERRRSL